LHDWNGGFKEKETRELSAQRTPDNVFVRERVHLPVVQIATAGKSFSFRVIVDTVAGEGWRTGWPCVGDRTDKETYSTGEGSPVFLMYECDDASRVLNNDGERNETKQREMWKTAAEGAWARKHTKKKNQQTMLNFFDTR